MAHDLGKRSTLARQLPGRAGAEASRGAARRLGQIARAAERLLGLIRELILQDALDPAGQEPASNAEG